MKTYNIFYIIFVLFVCSVSPHLRDLPPLPATTTSETTTLTTTSTTTEATTTVTSTTAHPIDTTMMPRYVFEGVDYNDLPENLRDYQNDCYGQFIKCVRNRMDHAPVCAYNVYTLYYNDFYSPCEIELQNCNYRVKKGYGVYGTSYKNDILFYNGEGRNCYYYLRRAKTPEDMQRLYFEGGDLK